MRTEFSLQVFNDPSRFHEVTARVQERLATSVPELGETILVELTIALEEALANAVVHGNLEISSETRDDMDVFQGLIRQRRHSLPYRDRRVLLNVRVTVDDVVFIVTDEGNGFDVSGVANPLAAENRARSHGRGLLIINSLMDEVQHNTRGNEITMIKRRSDVQTSAVRHNEARSA